MLPRAMTLSLCFADVENSVPCGLMKPLLRVVMVIDDLDDEVVDVDSVDSFENERSIEPPGPETARWGMPPGETRGEPGEGGVDGGVLELRVMLGFVRFFVGVVRGVALGVTSDEDMILFFPSLRGTGRRGAREDGCFFGAAAGVWLVAAGGR